MLEIKLFGSCEVRSPHNAGAIRRLSVRQRHILQLLALYRSVSKTDLAELLWEGNPPRSHAATLESHVFRLRRQLDPTSPSQGSVVVTRPGGYRLDDNRVEVDLWHFDRLLVQADGAPQPDALALLAQAVALSSAPLLADDPSRAWAVAARQHHEARLTEAASQAAGYALRLGDPHRAAALAARATDVNPLAEDAWQIRLKALYASGQRAAAITCYRSYRRSLADALGAQPSPAIHALFTQGLDDDGRGTSPGIDFGRAAVQVLAAAHELAGAIESADGLDRAAPQLLARTERIIHGLAGLHTPPHTTVTGRAAG